MDVLTLIWLFVFGAAIGSFLNVVVIRTKDERSIWGRSACMACGAMLRVIDMVPIVSFVWLKRRCRACCATISWQYPIVELLSGIFFVGIGAKFGLHLLTLNVQMCIVAIVAAVMWSLLLVIAVYDFLTTYIPDHFVYSFALVSLASTFITPSGFVIPSLLSLSAGPLCALPLFFLWVISRGRWIGLADSKLALGIGWLLGLTLGISAIVYAFWIGAAVSVALLGVKYIARVQTKFPKLAALTIKSEIPFGPFLVAGTAVAYFFSINMAAFLVQ